MGGTVVLMVVVLMAVDVWETAVAVVVSVGLVGKLLVLQVIWVARQAGRCQL